MEKSEEVVNAEIDYVLNVARSLHQDGALLQAEQCYLRAKDMRQPIEHSEDEGLQRQSFEIRRELHAIDFQKGNLKRSEEGFRELLDECHAVLSPNHTLILELGRWIAIVCQSRGAFLSAKQMIQDTKLRAQIAIKNEPEIRRDVEVELWALKQVEALNLGQFGQLPEALGLGEDVVRYLEAKSPSPTYDTIHTKEEDSQEEEATGESARVRSARMDLAKAKLTHAKLLAMQETYKKAEEENNTALEIMTRELGEGHVKTLESACLQSFLLAENGSLFVAERMCRKTISAMRTRLGDNHPASLQAMCVLASIFRRQGRLIQAEDILLQLCNDFKTNLELNPGHPQIIEVGNELSEVHIALGHMKSAKKNQLSVLHTAESAEQFDSDDPRLLKYKSMFIDIYLVLDDRKKARNFALDVLEKQKTRVVDAVQEGGLAMDFRNANGEENGFSMEELRSFLQQLVQMKSRLTIPYFRTMLSTLQSIALAMQDEESRGLMPDVLQSILDIRKQELGKTHVDTLSSLMCLGVAYREKGQLDTALDFLTEVLVERLDVLGKSHPDTLSARHEVSVTHFEIHRSDSEWLREVEAEQIQVLDLRSSLLGKHHPDTTRSLLDLAILYNHMEEWLAARDKQEEAVIALQEILEPSHEKTLRNQELLAQLKVTCAELELQSAERQESTDLKLQAMNNLARIHCEVQNWEEAEGLFKSVKENCSKNDPIRLSNELDWSLLYFHWGELENDKLEIAEKMQEELVKELQGSSTKLNADTLTVMFNLALTRRRIRIKSGVSEGHFEELDRLEELAQSHLGAGNPTRREMQAVRREWELADRTSVASESH